MAADYVDKGRNRGDDNGDDRTKSDGGYSKASAQCFHKLYSPSGAMGREKRVPMLPQDVTRKLK